MKFKGFHSRKCIWKCRLQKWRPSCLGLNELTLNVRGLSYLGLTRSISWLLMPWLLTSPGHQQPWYWLYRICRSFSYLREDFKYLCHINVDEWHKMWVYVYVPSEKFIARKGLSMMFLYIASDWSSSSFRASDLTMQGNMLELNLHTRKWIENVVCLMVAILSWPHCVYVVQY